MDSGERRREVRVRVRVRVGSKKELPHWIQVRGEGRERERSVIYVVAGGVQCTAYSIV